LNKKGISTTAIAIILVAIIAVAAAAYIALTMQQPPTQTEPEVSLQGAGATFPAPLMTKWASEYNKLHSKITINYQGVGSGGGIKAITDQTVDFGATDAPLKASEKAAASRLLLQIPETIGSVTVSYNIPGVTQKLNMTGDVIAKIFLGNITVWNDPFITSLNPGATLPAKTIFTVHRSESSGTTFVFTDYLSTVSSDWARIVGKGKAVSWPVGLGAKGNEGVTGVIQGNSYSIGYVELNYATTQSLFFAKVKNQAGNFILPSINSTAEAVAQSAPSLPSGDGNWESVSIVNALGANSYPISSMTYLLVYKDQTDKVKGKALVNFLWWIVHDGQAYSSGLTYVPLPQSVVVIDEAAIRMINYNGTSFIS
jgi:phosphate transport system substrate-binding protein